MSVLLEEFIAELREVLAELGKPEGVDRLSDQLREMYRVLTESSRTEHEALDVIYRSVAEAVGKFGAERLRLVIDGQHR